uniref:Uncharacterized protein n=1 Tax=Arundo donax TaxID=35708 RepID=A0A0A9GKC2_ARUDO
MHCHRLQIGEGCIAHRPRRRGAGGRRGAVGRRNPRRVQGCSSPPPPPPPPPPPLRWWPPWRWR